MESATSVRGDRMSYRELAREVRHVIDNATKRSWPALRGRRLLAGFLSFTLGAQDFGGRSVRDAFARCCGCV